MKALQGKKSSMSSLLYGYLILNYNLIECQHINIQGQGGINQCLVVISFISKMKLSKASDISPAEREI